LIARVRSLVIEFRAVNRICKKDANGAGFDDCVVVSGGVGVGPDDELVGLCHDGVGQASEQVSVVGRENTNGLLRQYLHQGTDLSLVTREELDAIQDSLNSRPRKTLGYLTPSEKLAEFLAPTG
jgi:hypothetical protein